MAQGSRGDSSSIFTISDGEVRAWVDGGVHIKAVTVYGDPVELASAEVRELIEALSRFLAELE